MNEKGNAPINVKASVLNVCRTFQDKSSFQALLVSKALNPMIYHHQTYSTTALLGLVQKCPTLMSVCVGLPSALTQECLSAVDGPVDEVEEDVRTRENHPGVFVNRVRVLDDVEGAQALFLLGGGGLAAHRQMDHHVLGFLRNLVQLLLLLLGHHGLLGVAGQAVGVGLAVGAVQHGHGSRLGHPAGAGQ